MIRIQTNSIKLLSDLTTPVSLMLKLREQFPEILLLESSDYSSKEDSQSFICFDPILSLQKQYDTFTIHNHISKETESLEDTTSVKAIDTLLNQLDITSDLAGSKYSGIFGFTSFDMVQEFEGIEFDPVKPNYNIPSMRYDLFRFTIVFDHFFEELYIIEHQVNGEKSRLEDIINIISRQDHQSFEFNIDGAEEGNMTDDQYIDIVHKAKDHCQRGDVFQMVLSRRFSQGFKGDEFNVYRALRSINPSPYLFYFDYGSYKIFGSSPEAQMIVSSGIAEIHPIAGTFKRSGNFTEDQHLAQKLLEDPKENAEHIMLVDLARNDLSKNCTEVQVAKYKEVQFFSHVIHLVSKVTGKIKQDISSYQIFADTFPAGTLSGAPKYKALQLIDSFEPTTRSFYGGGLGLIKLNGDLNHAIIIRSFLSKGGKLFYQSGAGIVIDSVPESELQEVHNKLAALKKALVMAQSI
ncbi:MAG: anthranilate synthase component I family protein [Saprospiraceae bacterium]|nr:anthranilate synthase component I family protein [Saprospiraceae bacterium]